MNYAKDLVLDMIGAVRIINSQDKWFNDIPLATWDQVAHFLPGKLSLSQKVAALKDAAAEIRTAASK